MSVLRLDAGSLNERKRALRLQKVISSYDAARRFLNKLTNEYRVSAKTVFDARRTFGKGSNLTDQSKVINSRMCVR